LYYAASGIVTLCRWPCAHRTTTYCALSWSIAKKNVSEFIADR